MGVKVRKKNGAWYVFIDHEGRRKAKKVGSREAAEKVKREIEARLTLGDFKLFSNETTSTFTEYSDRWLKHHAEVECKSSTIASYQQILRLYLFPRFANLSLGEISRDHVKDYLADLVAEGKVSRNTLRLIFCTLRVIFNYAIEDGLVDRNPAAKLGRFTKSDRPKRQATALTRKEVDALLDSAREVMPDYYPFLLTAVRAGLRRGELVALKWGDFQFGEGEVDPNRYLLVQHNYVHGRWTTPKSKKPRRVDMSRELRRVLLELRDQRLLEAFAQGRSSIADDLVFPSRAGMALST